MKSSGEKSFTKECAVPLEGIKVLDLSHVQSAPICGMMLADMGADVIKIEPLTGDMYRAPIIGAFYQNFNRNKRSIALNLKTKEGQEIAFKLVSNADILIENYKPGALNKIGLDYDSVRHLNKMIIYGSISGFGCSGRLSGRPAFDPNIQALSGMMDATGEPGRPPVRTRTAMIDYCAGATLASAVIAALWRREHSKTSAHIDVALMDIGLYAMAPYITYYGRTGKSFRRTGSAHPATTPNQSFKTLDGQIYIAATSNKMWKALCEVLKTSELCEDERFNTREKRFTNRIALLKNIDPVIRKWKSKTLESRLVERGIPCGIIRSIAEVYNDPYLEERGISEDLMYPDDLVLRTFKTPICYNGRMPFLRRRAPSLGEDTSSILMKLGYSDSDVCRLADRGVVLCSENKRVLK